MNGDKGKSRAGGLLQNDVGLTRRDVLRGAGIGLSGGAAALLFGCGGSDDDDGHDGPPEVTTIRMPWHYGLCAAPMYVAKEYLLDEGFTKVLYPGEAKLSGINPGLEKGTYDISFNSAAVNVVDIDKGSPLVMLAGVHVGCYELFARDDIRSIDDLRGKRVAITETQANSADLAFMTNVLTWIGGSVGGSDGVELKPFTREEILTVIQEGRAEAILTIPPVTHQLRDLNVGRVLINTMKDTPWSNNFCCQLSVRREFLEDNPAATKRAVRAILKGADLCVTDPEFVAQYLVDHAFTSNRQFALDTVKMVRYGHWREFDSEASVMFNAVRMHDSGVIKRTPKEIIKKGTDWRFLNELKNEMAYFPPQDPTRSAFALGCDIEPAAYGPSLITSSAEDVGSEDGTS